MTKDNEAIDVAKPVLWRDGSVTRPEELIEYADGVERPAHSDKGASGAERWMNCPGSSALIAAFEMPETDEPSYRAEGIAMHEAAAHCLAADADTWEIVGQKFHDVEITADMANGVQMYLDRVRPGIDRDKGFHGEQFFIEARLAAPDIHEKMFGSVDFGALVSRRKTGECNDDAKDAAWKTGFLDVTDLKGGEGIVVDPDDNPQLKYYAFMLIHTKFNDLDDEFPVRLTIVQPRAFHVDGPIREWWTTVGEIKAWVVRDLLPAMRSTDDELQAGSWCRFCPAKLVCPLLTGLFKAAASFDPKAVIEATDVALGLSYGKIEAVKFYLKALEEEVFRRLQANKTVAGTKLVNKKANRVFKETVTVQVEGKPAEVDLVGYMKKTFGERAFTAPELRTPADFAKLGGAEAEFVKQYAYTPVTGLTVALETDRRPGVKVQTVQERLDPAILAKLQGEASAE